MAEKTTYLGDLTGDELVSKAYSLFEDWRSKYESEWNRQNANENLYLGKHWDDMGSDDNIKPMTPIIHSTVENMSADLMDNFPQAIITAETPDDEIVADIIGGIIKQNHDATNYRREYHKACHDLLVSGWCVQEVGYDPLLNHKLGGAFIRYVDCHNIMFDPQVTDIQVGRAVFKFAPQTIEYLEQRYPDHAGKFAVDSYSLETDSEIDYDENASVLLIECWWKSWDPAAELWRVHMAQMAGRQLLSDSRDEKPDGYINTGEFPFVVTPLFRRKNSPLGYGVPDMFGTMQKYSDKMDSIVVKNAAMAAVNKLLNTHMSGFDTEDLMDWTKEVHEGENLNGLTWMPTAPLPQYIIGEGQAIRENIKDESGANDFSRGNTNSGVTSGSAIAALQEASSKRTRAVSLLMQESYKELVRYEIEFERDFNVLPREVVIIKDGQQTVQTFESALMERTTVLGNEVPMEFLISIKVERESRFSIMAHNELILQMVQLGVVTPQQAVELMEFEGKESVLNKTIQQQQQMDPAMEQAMQEQAALDEQISNIGSPEQILTQEEPMANQV